MCLQHRRLPACRGCPWWSLLKCFHWLNVFMCQIEKGMPVISPYSLWHLSGTIQGVNSMHLPNEILLEMNHDHTHSFVIRRSTWRFHHCLLDVCESEVIVLTTLWWLRYVWGNTVTGLCKISSLEALKNQEPCLDSENLVPSVFMSV